MASNEAAQPTSSTVSITPTITNNNKSKSCVNAQDSNRNGGQGGAGGHKRGTNGGRGSNTSNPTWLQATNPIKFEGDKTYLGTVIGLKIEMFYKMTNLTIFKEKVYNYIISNFKDEHDLRPLFKDGSDLLKTHKDKKKPKEMAPAADNDDC